MKRLRILIACEESQVVCKAFRERGHEAYSCDIQDCSGGHPEWHFKEDVFEVIEKYGPWDMMIAFPECRYLCWSGERWLTNNPERLVKRMEAFEFLKRLYNSNIPLISVENSLSLFLERKWKKPTQKIHPFHFGDPFRKTTCLWLRGLKPLIPTNILFHRIPAAHNQWPSKDRSKIRAKTYPGIAKAMAEQWSEDLTK